MVMMVTKQTFSWIQPNFTFPYMSVLSGSSSSPDIRDYPITFDWHEAHVAVSGRPHRSLV